MLLLGKVGEYDGDGVCDREKKVLNNDTEGGSVIEGLRMKYMESECCIHSPTLPLSK